MDARARAAAELEAERDELVRWLAEFCRAQGVRLSPWPLALHERVTQGLARMLDAGQALAHDKETIPAASERPEAPTSASGVRPAEGWPASEKTPARGRRGRRGR